MTLFRKTKGDPGQAEAVRNNFTQQTMNTRVQKINEGEPQRGRTPDVSSTECGMIAGDVHGADIQTTVTPNRRLRNLILLANALAWVIVIMVIRWLFS